MIKFKSKNKDISYKHDRVVRIISHFKDGTYIVGTGFLVNDNRNILTCWHVICGVDLKDFLKSAEFQQSVKTTESEKVDEYFRNITSRIEVELPDGKKITAILKSYDYYYDLAVLIIPEGCGKLPFFELELNDVFDYLDEVNFTGYPRCLGYELLNSPFAANVGTISSFPEIDVTGGKYQMTQLTSICIGGNSGAPLFKKGCNKVYGIVNGYEWRGESNVAVFKDQSFSHTVDIKVPINISYATELNLLLSKSDVFKNLVSGDD